MSRASFCPSMQNYWGRETSKYEKWVGGLPVSGSRRFLQPGHAAFPHTIDRAETTWSRAVPHATQGFPTRSASSALC